MSDFAMRLKQLRKDNHMTQAELAEKIGVSKSSVNMYERGEREPSFETLEAIADTFNATMDYLLGRSKEHETFAALNFLRDTGYVLLNTIPETAAAVLFDKENNQWYEIPIEDFDEAERSIVYFAKYRMHELLKNFKPRVHLKRKIEPDND